MDFNFIKLKGRASYIDKYNRLAFVIESPYIEKLIPFNISYKRVPLVGFREYALKLEKKMNKINLHDMLGRDCVVYIKPTAYNFSLNGEKKSGYTLYIKDIYCI